MAQESIEQLKNLKEKLDNQLMSVLVGAGFSKNISNIFPSWWEMLYDMTLFLYKNEIEEFLSRRNPEGIKDNKKLTDEKIGEYIEKIGSSNIVSKYIERKGMREAVTTYIEEKIPKIINYKNKTTIKNKIKKEIQEVKLDSKMLSQHKLLLQLPWNNIYTTNFDEMLEWANDSTVSEKITSEINRLNKKTEDLFNEKNKFSYKIEELESKNTEIETKLIKEIETLLNFMGHSEQMKKLLVLMEISVKIM